MDLKETVAKLLAEFSQKEINEALRSELEKKGKIAVVVNSCYGRFELSSAAAEALGMQDDSIDRADPRLVALLKEKGSQWCSGPCADLRILEVPVGSDWVIDAQEGIESVRW